MVDCLSKLPIEILDLILMNSGNIFNIMLASKELYFKVYHIIKQYENIYDKLFNGWRFNISILITLLCKNNMERHLMFLLNNYKIGRETIDNSIIRGGNINYIEHFVYNLYYVDQIAVEIDDIELLKWAFSKNIIKNKIRLATIAAKLGRLEILEFLNDIYKFEKSLFSSIATFAAKYGIVNIFEWCINMGADNYNFYAAIAAKNGHSNIILILNKQHGLDYNDIIKHAYINENFYIVSLLGMQY